MCECRSTGLLEAVNGTDRLCYLTPRAVGIEDELQDGVPETIELNSAGLNVWMITGL